MDVSMNWSRHVMRPSTQVLVQLLSPDKLPLIPFQNMRLKNGEPQPASGRQELFENIINEYL